MASAPSGLIFVLDENNAGLLPVLRAARVTAHDRLSDLPSVGIPTGTLDPEMLRGLGRQGRFALIARDGKMLDPLVQREAWRLSGVTVFLMGKQWGQLPLRELSRRLLFLWPTLVDRAELGAQGSAWRVAHRVPDVASGAFRLVTTP